MIALILSLTLLLCFPTGVSAAEPEGTGADTAAKGSLTIYKVDLTSAEKDGAWDSSYVSTGVYDQNVNDTLNSYAAQKHDLNGIKDKTVGNGQHGTARWATRQEVKRTYHHIPYTPNQWRQAAKEGKQPTSNGKPLPQGIVLGCQGGRKTMALVDSDDVHVLMIGASGVGKTAYFLYPNLEYACASGMSFLALDTKGDLARNYGAIARDIYGYRISVVDLREPTRSDGNNLLTLINRYMDDHREDSTEITAKAKAEKYAKILAKTIISPEGEGSDHGQNAYFYDAAEGLLASVVLLLSEFLPPEETDGYETRHIASVFKLV